MSRSDFLDPFATPSPSGATGLYLPDAAVVQPSPAVVFVHGGSDTSGYASLMTAGGVAWAIVEADLLDADAYGRAADQLRAEVARVRDDSRVDADRIALWFFGESGLLSAEWLRTPPPWLRCLALTYPLLDALPGHPVWPRFRPIAAVDDVGAAAWAGVAGAMRASALPIVLTRAGRERPEVAATVEAFVSAAEAAQANLTIVDVPTARHANEPQPIVTAAADHVLTALRIPA